MSTCGQCETQMDEKNGIRPSLTDARICVECEIKNIYYPDDSMDTMGFLVTGDGLPFCYGCDGVVKPTYVVKKDRGSLRYTYLFCCRDCHLRCKMYCSGRLEYLGSLAPRVSLAIRML